MASKRFKKEYLKDTLGLPYANSIQDKIIDQGRWTVEHELVFQNPKDGKYYQCHYSVGATEMQDERPWEYDSEIICMEVRPCFVETLSYLPVENKRLASANELLNFFRDNNLTEEMSEVLGDEAVEDVIRDSSNDEIRRCVANYIDNEAAKQRALEPVLAKRAEPAKEDARKGKGVPPKFVDKFVEKMNAHAKDRGIRWETSKEGSTVKMSCLAPVFYGTPTPDEELDMEAVFKTYQERKSSGDKKPMAYVVELAYADEFNVEKGEEREI